MIYIIPRMPLPTDSTRPHTAATTTSQHCRNKFLSSVSSLAINNIIMDHQILLMLAKAMLSGKAFFRLEITTASRPTKVYGWKFTHHGWISNHYLENQPLVGKPTTLWLEILPSSQPHRYHNSALYILFDKGKVEENSTS